MKNTNCFSYWKIWFYATAVCILIPTLSHAQTPMQEDPRVIRIAKIKIDSAYVERYNSMLKEGIETAVKTEPGVIMLYAVQNEKDVTDVTVFEIYANRAAYEFHIQTPHFKKYKNGTTHMVKALELTDVNVIALASKPKL